MSQEKAGWFTFPKEKDKDYLTSITKKASKFIGPNHYKRSDYNLFKTDEKEIRYASPKAAKNSLFTEESKRRAFIPGSNKYNTKDMFYRTIGTIHT